VILRERSLNAGLALPAFMRAVVPDEIVNGLIEKVGDAAKQPGKFLRRNTRRGRASRLYCV
jgi:hypothetical protein